MSVCAFFGHYDCPDTIVPALKRVITELIVKENFDTFYVGNNGKFDEFVTDILDEMQKKYNINCYTVYACKDYIDNFFTGKLKPLYPDLGGEEVPALAVIVRNTWMIFRADCIITYIVRDKSEAARLANDAKFKNKRIINVAKLTYM